MNNPQTSAKTSAEDQTKGVVVRGADGQLYFIPSQKLQAFKVPEKAVEKLASKLPTGQVAANTSVSTEWMHNLGACMMTTES